MEDISTTKLKKCKTSSFKWIRNVIIIKISCNSDIQYKIVHNIWEINLDLFLSLPFLCLCIALKKFQWIVTDLTYVSRTTIFCY